MPTYLYRCLNCHTEFEVVQSFKDEPISTFHCHACGTEQPVKKVFTPVGITFKGSGFYKTDSRSGSGGSKGGSSEGGDKAEGGGDKAAATASSSSTDS